MPLKTCIKVIQGDVERGFLLRLLIGSAKNRTEKIFIRFVILGKAEAETQKPRRRAEQKKRRLVIILRTRGFFRILPENAARQR